MRQFVNYSEKWIEKGYLPDFVIRFGIRTILKESIQAFKAQGLETGQSSQMQLIDHLKSCPIAVQTQAANEQHYELPPEFFQRCLGKHLKYSSCYWKPGVKDLSQAEADMLAITCERAGLQDGQDILELGCGWGSLSLFMAERFKKSRITAVSNSKTQKDFIDAQITSRKIKNLEIITRDINDLALKKLFDRVVSVEMFEHMRNFQLLFAKIAHCLKKNGCLFVHIFTHREYTHIYDESDQDDFIAKYFFTGGMMPADDLLLYFQDDLKISDHWRVPGTHYEKTANAWLVNMDQNKERIYPLFKDLYGDSGAEKWWNFWRVFYMACAELWGYRNGTEWLVSHYLFSK